MWQALSAPVGFKDVSLGMTTGPKAYKVGLTEERVNTAYDADKERQALHAPSSTILKLSEHIRRAAVVRRAHQRYQDPEGTANVDDEDQALDLWEKSKSRQDSVEKETDENHSVEQQRPLPPLRPVYRVVEHDKTLDDGSSQICRTCGRRLPP